MVALLERLAVEVGRELPQGLEVEVNGDRDVLLRRGELTCNLFVQSLWEPGHACERNMFVRSALQAAFRPFRMHKLYTWPEHEC